MGSAGDRLDGPLRRGHGPERCVRHRDRPAGAARPADPFRTGRAVVCRRAGGHRAGRRTARGLAERFVRQPGRCRRACGGHPGLRCGTEAHPPGPRGHGGVSRLEPALGLTHTQALGGPVAWLAAAMFGLFVCGITWISRSETESGRTGNLLAGLTVQDLALIGLMAAALQPGKYPSPLPGRPLIPLEGLLVLALVALAVNLAASRAIYQPVPAVIQRAVKTGILALVWIDVGLVAAVRGPEAAAAIAGLWVPAYLLGRWLYST